MTLVGSECDVLFLSYSEPQAERNFQSLLKRYPRLKRLHGVTGMGRAYKMTAEVVDTPYYFLVDADSEIREDFDFDSVEVPEEPNLIRIWSTENAVNGLVYGYGGLKLCSREGMRTLKDDTLDVLGSGKNKLVFEKQIASTTRFNVSPYDAWKAGFRECCMLQAGSGIHMPKEKAEARIQIWKTKGEDKEYGSWAIRGAYDGSFYALRNVQDFHALKKIDDPKWLKEEFFLRYPEQGGV